MDVKKAASLTSLSLRNIHWDTDDHSFSKGHISYMLHEIENNEDMKNDKANRWLGWAQAVICQYTTLTVDDMKHINKSS